MFRLVYIPFGKCVAQRTNLSIYHLHNSRNKMTYILSTPNPSYPTIHALHLHFIQAGTIYNLLLLGVLVFLPSHHSRTALSLALLSFWVGSPMEGVVSTAEPKDNRYDEKDSTDTSPVHGVKYVNE